MTILTLAGWGFTCFCNPRISKSTHR